MQIDKCTNGWQPLPNRITSGKYEDGIIPTNTEVKERSAGALSAYRKRLRVRSTNKRTRTHGLRKAEQINATSAFIVLSRREQINRSAKRTINPTSFVCSAITKADAAA